MTTTACRDCSNQVSFSAVTCPSCGAPKPYEAEFTGWGFEWRSKRELLGLPLVHVCFKYRMWNQGNAKGSFPVKIARGWLAIGQFSAGVVNISQFGFGPICLSQISLAGVALSQITAAVYAVCQVGVVGDGWGQVVLRLRDLL